MMDAFSRIPTFYFPTNVMIIDDDRELLNAIGVSIDQFFPYILQDDPNKAFEYLDAHGFKAKTLYEQLGLNQQSDYFDDFGENPLSDCSVDLLKNLGTHHRFEHLSCVVIDRAMGEVDGLEVCHRIRKHGLMLKRILLTGNTGTDEAVQAFNEREIDAYVAKTAEYSGMSAINAYLKNLSWAQFLEIGDNLIGSFSSKASLLADESFVEVFHQIREANQIIEFYLYDASGSFIMCDADGNAKLLLVKHGDDFETMLDIMEDTVASENAIRQITDKTAYPYSTNRSDLLSASGEQWEKLLTPMSRVGDSDVFYTLLEAPASIGTIYPFSKYASEVWSVSRL